MDTLAQCFKGNIGPHFAIDKAIGHEKKYFKKLSTWQKLKIWFIVFLASLVPFTLYTFDVSTDGLLVDEYDTGKSLSEALLFAEHGENMLCTEIFLNVRNNFCTQHVLSRFELGIFMY